MSGERADYRIPSLLECLWLVLLVRVGLKVLGLRRVLRIMSRLVTKVPRLADPPRRLLLDAEWVVSRAAALFPGRARCLEQSLALYYLLRRAGVTPDLRFAVQSHPFRAHVWVDVDGQPLNDWPEHVKQFAVLQGVRS